VYYAFTGYRLLYGFSLRTLTLQSPNVTGREASNRWNPKKNGSDRGRIGAAWGIQPFEGWTG
jgi:hypothetical protein